MMMVIVHSIDMHVKRLATVQINSNQYKDKVYSRFDVPEVGTTRCIGRTISDERTSYFIAWKDIQLRTRSRPSYVT
jgi:hypothetical protein